MVVSFWVMAGRGEALDALRASAAADGVGLNLVAARIRGVLAR